MEKETVIIVGAGATGLMAANELSGRCHIILLEASSRLGGRIWSKESGRSSHIIEGGAEFIHGHQKLTLQLLKEAGIELLPVEGKMYRKEKGIWTEQTEMIEGWDELLEQMKKTETDMMMYDFLHQYFGNDKYADLRRHATYYAEGFDLADIKKASVQALYKEWSNEEEENFRIRGGYGALVNFLKTECERKGCRILTNQVVRQIDWEKNEVTVYTNNKENYSGTKLIVAVPVNILIRTGDDTSVNFTPPIDEYISAGHEIGIGPVIKVVFRFYQRFWKEDMGFVFSDEIFPTWWTQLPDTTPVLSGWAGSTKAEQLKDYNNEQILDKAIRCLSSVFDKPHDELINNLEESNVFNWQSEEFSLHGYSYSTLKTSAARKLLNTPIDDTVFFAGEGLYEGKSPGTVEAALVKGKEVAGRI